jgi:DNA-directed RNA polymerase specialized sigma24 family protein
MRYCQGAVLTLCLLVSSLALKIGSMTDPEITSEVFETLLEWLGPTREQGGEKYEVIRARLIKIFLKRGCSDPENLADKTVNRVILKLPEIKDGYKGDPLWYFISTARIVRLEALRNKEIPYESVPDFIVNPDPDFARECLQKCLALLPEDQRDLVLDYYVNEKGAKIDLHRKLAEELGLSANALRLRTHRIRGRLESCVLECLNAGAK